jgi:hypothetical protein
MTEEEVEERWKARIDLIKAVKARKYEIKREALAMSLNLGDAAQVAIGIDKRQKELSREFKVAPQKGVRHQSTIVKRQQKEQQRREKLYEKDYNPKIKGLGEVPGLTMEEDGTIRLKDLREQRPDILAMKPKPALNAGNKIEVIARLRAKEGRKDKYGHVLNN